MADDLRDLCRRKQGDRSLRAFAREIGVDSTLLSRLYSGSIAGSPSIALGLLRAYPHDADVQRAVLGEVLCGPEVAVA